MQSCRGCYFKFHFNSIKVRLEHIEGDHVSKDTRFQFHKGTIRTPHRHFHLLTIEDFNSIKVRLELQPASSKIETKVFQFHKGTIRTTEDTCLQLMRNQFQFHKGTIRTQAKTVNAVVGMYFNSIKVRLEQQAQERKATTTYISIP